MLKLTDIRKSYKTGDFEQKALDGVTLEFRESEFVAVLGASGSGKTTLLNVVGGLDRYDSGQLEINGRPTSEFCDRDWDAYRNNSVGFIFQSYNLIGHISVLANVEMGMTLSGLSKSERSKKALEALRRVGLEKHAKKRPGQLSGGQMQRVAIARALANDPDIILADEPTGALDSETSVQILELIKEIAGDKLVIMVTHNADLAHRYASRIVELSDGRVVSDSDPLSGVENAKTSAPFKKTAMNFFTALSLSFTNIMTKKGRTLLTAFASSIGIIGIALILALSNGFDKQINSFEAETLSSFPITITQQSMSTDADTINAFREQQTSKEGEFPEEKVVYPFDSSENQLMHVNKITAEYLDYIGNIASALGAESVSDILYTRMTPINAVSGGRFALSTGVNFSELPTKLSPEGVVENNYDLLYGRMPENENEVLLVLNRYNRLDRSITGMLGFSGDEAIPFSELTGISFDLFPSSLGGAMAGISPESEYDPEAAVTVTVTGIVRMTKDSMLTLLMPGIAYTSALSEKFAGSEAPYMINIFPTDFDSKKLVTDYLDGFNKGLDEADMVLYTDYAETFSSLAGDIMDAITIVLIAFSSISLVVSVIMIGIITYISVLERTREIGVLRALGARKKDITRVFDAETFITGACSGLIGILIARLLVIPTNIIIEKLTNVAGVAQMNPLHALLLVSISVALTVLGGFIPAKMAARRDPVAALRAE